MHGCRGLFSAILCMKVCCDTLIKYLTNSQHNTEIAVYVIDSNV